MKPWINKAFRFLEHSLGKIPQELNELDWKESLSPNNDKLCRHLCAFANHPGGGFLAFGIQNASGKPIGITRTDADQIVGKLSSLCRDGVDPVTVIDHSIEEFQG